MTVELQSAFVEMDAERTGALPRRPRVSVVVASTQPRQFVESRLAGLFGPCVRSGAEVVVVHPGAHGPRTSGAPRPGASVHHIRVGAGTAPEDLRSIGLRHASGDIVVLLDDPWSMDAAAIESLVQRGGWRRTARLDAGFGSPFSLAGPVAARRISVIVPSHDGEATLGRCLSALSASTLPREEWELVVVDDSSSDLTATIAARHADVVVRLPGAARGADYARNRGVEVSCGTLLVFLSDDVIVAPDTLARLVAVLDADETIGAACGSYDAEASAPGALTSFQLLLHGYLRHASGGEVDAFFAGLGVIRREVLRSVGLFDEWHRSRPRVSAIETGRRVRLLGRRVVMRSDIRARHVKERRWWDMVVATLRDHGQPYETGWVDAAERVNGRLRRLRRIERTTLAATMVAALTLLLFSLGLPIPRSVLLGVVGAALALALALNLPFYAFAARRRSVSFLLAVVPLHIAGSLVMAASRIGDTLRRWLVGEPRPTPAIEAFVEVGVETWPPVPARRPGAVAP